MNIKMLWQAAPVTLLLIAGFVLVMVIQSLLGVRIDDPSMADLLRFGANFLPATLHEPWRLVSSGFLHIGILHLLFNSFAMYYLGQAAEMILGGLRLLGLFLLSVMGGSLLVNYEAWQMWQLGKMPTLTAGASGGIMDIGAFLLILAMCKTPVGYVLNTKGLAITMAINLLVGFAVDGISNAGHIGGSLVGVTAGVLYALLHRFAKHQWLPWVISAVVLASIYAWQMATWNALLS
ncbi:rhomboid family intramembrane serine protease [Moraxella cuniculi]|nr:rhomboid family intramembrane serine protease [Moraxella cuniculi]